MAAGYYHTVVLKNNGTVVAWGWNAYGQTYVPVAAQSGVTAMAAGYYHTVALKNDGTVVAWGDNSYGQTTVPGAAQNGVTAIAAGALHTVALKNDGTVVLWGYSDPAPAGLTGVMAIAAGYYHTVALLSPTRIQFAAADYALTENAGAVSIIVERLGDLSGTHTVKYATQDGSAAAGTDYTAQSGTLTFAPGQTIQTVSIPIFNDGVAESAETFQVLLTNLTGFQALLGVPTTSTVTILDNDTGIQFSAAQYSVRETGGLATITVLRGDDLNVAATVDYATSDGTATAGADYTARSGTLHFAAGETTQTILIPILDDGLHEGPETVNLTLSNPSADVSLGVQSNAVLTILDDERQINIGRGQLKAIAAGQYHTLALKADGSLWAWGGNWAGQLGDGTMDSRVAPVHVGTDTDWTAVAAGSAHSVGLKADGSLWAWGLGWSQTGPGRIGTDNDWSVMAAGTERTLALKTDGSLWVLNQTAQVRLGLDNEWRVIATAQVELALKTDGSLWQVGFGAPQRVGTDNDWFTVTAGGSANLEDGYLPSNLALKADGRLFAWGANPAPVPIGTDNDWAAITVGSYHSAALKQDGNLWAWGGNYYGQLGIGTLLSTNRPARAGTDNNWVVIAAGGAHTVALKADGSLWAWGANYEGQLGIGAAPDVVPTTNIPVRVGTDNDWALPTLFASEFRITSQAVGGDGRFRLAFTPTNYLSYFILYRGTEVTNILQPVDATLGPFVFQLSDPTPVSSNASAFYRVRAVPLTQPLDLDGDGIDDVYELRHRAFLDPLNPADAALDYDGDGKSNLQEYLAGSDSSRRPGPALAANSIGGLILKTNGSLWTFDGGQGPPQRFGGNSNYVDVFPGGFPVRVGDDWVAASTSYRYSDPLLSHTLALKAGGSLWAWGNNGYGQLGNGTNDFANPNPNPARIGTNTDWTAVAAGTEFSTAIKADGTLWAWGANWGWQLGNGRTDDGTNVPVQVGADHDWVAVDNSKYDQSEAYTLALKADGTLWSWGSGPSGELGLGKICCTNVPTRIGTDSDWRGFSAGAYHVAALSKPMVPSGLGVPPSEEACPIESAPTPTGWPSPRGLISAWL